MPQPQAAQRVGLRYLHDVTELLQRIRRSHPTAGLYEAADLQWWWVDARPSTDSIPQLFWFDRLGRPEAAVIATDWGEQLALNPIVMHDATPDWIAHVFEQGLAHVSASGFVNVSLEVDRADDVLRDVVVGHGFAIEEEDGMVEMWLTADSRPEISPLREGYRLSRRIDTMHQTHHMNHRKRHHPDVEVRLRETSLYRPDLDLVIHDRLGAVAAYGLFWYDPASATGLVEPMRTDDDHQQRGLARHILTTGIGLLTEAGAERIKICHHTDNSASKHLYLSAGFRPDRKTDVYARRPVAVDHHQPTPDRDER